MTLKAGSDTGIGLDGPYVPSPSERVRTQVAEYEASGGVEGATLEGRAVVILTSVGAKSGKVRKNPVMQIVDGPRAIEEFIAPTITQAAADAGQPPPRIIASVPVAATKNPGASRADAVTSLHFYDQFPSYQKIMAREGVTSAADLAVIGDPDA